MTKKKPKNAYLEVDNTKYMEYKFGETRPSRKSVTGASRKSELARVNKAQTSRVQKERVREQIERQRILKETRRWREGPPQEKEEAPVRANHKREEQEYSASKRRLRYCFYDNLQGNEHQASQFPGLGHHADQR